MRITVEIPHNTSLRDTCIASCETDRKGLKDVDAVWEHVFISHGKSVARIGIGAPAQIPSVLDSLRITVTGTPFAR